jgi:transposase
LQMDAERRIAELESAVAERDLVIAAQRVELASLEEEVRQLKELVDTLQAKLSENSQNSGRPPSSDGPGARKTGNRNKKPKKKGKKRGAQTGHKGKHRELLPVEAVDHVVDVYPPTCGNCEAGLPEIEDPRPMRHQVTEIPEPKPEVTEYRCHAVDCGCGHRTRATLDGIADSAFGPRLSAIIAMLSGVYHLSRRATRRATRELLGVRISLGAISGIERRVANALEPSVDEAWEKVRAAKVKNTDGTTWLESGTTMQLWTIVAAARPCSRSSPRPPRTRSAPSSASASGSSEVIGRARSTSGPWRRGKSAGPT